jgi:SWI/SNF-related matrix-associated actin-dependent regulator 1 of chromatin subfamily A
MNLYPYQQIGAEWLASKRHAILCDAPGLGKTAQAIRAIMRFEPWDLESVLIICPASLRINWAREWDMWMGEHKSLYPAPVIISYDKARVDKQIYNKRWSVVVLDEAQALKNRGAKRTKKLIGRTKWVEQEQAYVRDGGLRADYIWFMTGTPISTCPANFFNVLNFCCPAEFPDRHGYEVEFCDGHYGLFGWKAEGATQLAKLREKIMGTREKPGTVYLRRSKEEVLRDLPPKRRQIIEIPRDDIDQEGRAALAQEQALILPLAQLAANDSELYDAVMRIRYSHKTAVLDPQVDEGAANAHDLRRLLAPAKVAAFAAWARDTILPDPSEKVVVWAYYKSTVAMIAERLTRLGIKHVVFDGSTNATDRDNAVTSFQNDPAVQVFIGSSAAYTGITLTAASRAVFVEASTVPSDNIQAEDRIHRLGQTESVLIQYLAVERSYDLRMLRVAVERLKSINTLLG